MSDALGGVVNIALIVFFTVVIALYMAFNVNYQKAFNVKNKIINIIEKYDGACENDCYQEIIDYEKNLGYGNINIKSSSSNEYCDTSGGFCIEGIDAHTKYDEDTYDSVVTYCYFNVRTQVMIDIPIINNLMGLSFFQVQGQTKNIKIKNYDSCNKEAKKISG